MSRLSPTGRGGGSHTLPAARSPDRASSSNSSSLEHDHMLFDLEHEPIVAFPSACSRHEPGLLKCEHESAARSIPLRLLHRSPDRAPALLPNPQPRTRAHHRPHIRISFI